MRLPVVLALVLAAALAAAPQSNARAPGEPPAECGPRHVDEVLSVDHFLFLPDEESARAAAEDLGEERYRQQVHEAAMEPSWVLYLEHRELPSRNDFDGDRQRLRELAERHGGRYGWHGCITERWAIQ